jgi:hypothetical protein
MRTSPLILSLLCFTAIACGDEKSDGDFAPQEGLWERGDVTEDDGCGFGGIGGGDTGGENVATIAVSDDGEEFTIDTGDSDPITCTLDDQSYTCEGGSSEEVDYAEYGYDAVATISSTVGGEFSSETEGTFEVSVSVSCDGADCAEVAELSESTYPCTSSASWPISAR